MATAFTDLEVTLRTESGAQEESLRCLTSLDEATLIPTLRLTALIELPHVPLIVISEAPEIDDATRDNADVPMPDTTDLTEPAQYPASSHHGDARVSAAVRATAWKVLADHSVFANTDEDFARSSGLRETMCRNR